MANSGFESLSQGCDKLFVKNFSNYDYIVGPSGSCVLHIKDHLHDHNFPEESKKIRNSIFEITEFLTDILKITSIDASFPHKVGLHQSCHGQRGLHLSQMSELSAPAFSKPQSLLSQVKGIQLMPLDRPDECCGFGGTFCVFEEAVSSKMGIDRVHDHERNGVEYITASDMSCLMHLEGILKRKQSPIQVKHIVEILNAKE